jgi:predicted Zn-dependent protease with MMP-like domain
VDVVKGCSAGTGSTNAAIGLFATAVADTCSDESAHELSLITCVLNHTHDFGMSVRGDGIGVTDKANLVLVLDNAASFDGVL